MVARDQKLDGDTGLKNKARLIQSKQPLISKSEEQYPPAKLSADLPLQLVCIVSTLIHIQKFAYYFVAHALFPMLTIT